MLTSINPLGEVGRKQNWGLTVFSYMVGNVVGGSAVGLVLGSIGLLIPDASWTLWLLVGLLVLGGVADAFRWSPPGIHRQVDENWLSRYRGWVYGFGFGFQLGTGVATIVTTTAIYSMMAMLILVGNPMFGLAVGAAFGLARSLPVLLAARASTFDRLTGVMVRVERWRPWARRLPAVAQFVLAGILIFA